MRCGPFPSNPYDAEPWAISGEEADADVASDELLRRDETRLINAGEITPPPPAAPGTPLAGAAETDAAAEYAAIATAVETAARV